jgi:hypothetical protein
MLRLGLVQFIATDRIGDVPIAIKFVLDIRQTKLGTKRMRIVTSKLKCKWLRSNFTRESDNEVIKVLKLAYLPVDVL